MNDRYKIKNVAINITDLNDAVRKIQKKAENKSPGYVCVTNVRSVYFGNHDSEFCKILNNSFLTVPDGKPLEWYARIAGLKQVKRTSGPDLFEQICQLSESKRYTHFFYGSTPDVIEKVKKNLLKKYPKLEIVGAISPPFRPVEELASDEIIKQINDLKPTFVWVGLGAPKQEHFINLVINKVTTSLFIGVGLVFDYQAGTVKRAPKWMQRNGLEWLYRNVQQPKRYLKISSLSRLFSIIPLLFKVFFEVRIKGKTGIVK